MNFCSDVTLRERPRQGHAAPVRRIPDRARGRARADPRGGLRHVAGLPVRRRAAPAECIYHGRLVPHRAGLPRSVAWPGTRMVWLPGQRSNTSAECRRRRTRLRRRSVIEPLIGPMKVDGLTDRNCLLKGAAGDAMRAILCAASEPAPAAASDRRFSAPQRTDVAGVGSIAALILTDLG